MKSFAIIGTGAIGGYYGAKLQNAGFEVHFLLNSDYEYVQKNGLKVDSSDGDILLPIVNAWNSATEIPKCDIVIITLKTTANHLLKEILPQVCHPNSKVLVLQNGLDSDKDSAEAVPENDVYGGVCSIAANKVGPGHIKHLAYNEIRIGKYSKDHSSSRISEDLKEISKHLNSAGIKTVLSENATEARWRKLVWNVTFNGLTTILNCDTKVIMTTPEFRQRAISIMNEVVYTANSCGFNIEAEFIDAMIALTDNMGPYLPSMKLDYDNGRPLELETIYYQAMRYADKNKCKISEIRQLVNELESLEK